MIRLLLALALCVSPVSAQTITTGDIAVSFEQLTVSNTAAGFASATYTGPGGDAFRPTRCVGISEDATFRFRVDGTSPTATVGNYVPIGATVELKGYDVIKNFKAIRTGGTNAVIAFTCYR